MNDAPGDRSGSSGRDRESVPAPRKGSHSVDASPTRRIGIAALLLAVLLGAVVFSPRIGADNTLLNRTLHNFAHGPVFGGVALVLLFGLRGQARFAAQPLVRQYVFVFGLAALLGLATEIAQRFTARDSSLEDLATDLLGAAGVLLLCAAFELGRRARARQVRATLVVAGFLALGALSWPLVLTMHTYVERARAFPVIADFTQGVGLPFTFARNARVEIAPMPQRWAAADGERALQVQLQGADWPGIEIAEPSPDWSGYGQLAIELVNPNSFELAVSIRIDDRHHDFRFEDRYNATFRLAPLARTTLRIPLEEIESAPHGRKLDLRNVARVLMFRREALREEAFYLVRVELE